jgi:hypothetical protein
VASDSEPHFCALILALHFLLQAKDVDEPATKKKRNTKIRQRIAQLKNPDFFEFE